MRIRNFLFISATMMLAFNFTRPVHADSADTATIAIIADKASNLDRSPLVSLLEAQLSQTQSVKLLERAAIDKVLEEQRLNAAGLLDRSTTIKIGKLLRADVFIILSRENHSNTTSGPIPPGAIPNKGGGFASTLTTPSELNQTEEAPTENSQADDSGDLIRVRLAETAHGLRLLDYFEQSNSANPQEAVAGIIRKVQSVLGKINQPGGKLIPVGIVDIHRVELGEKYKMLERTLP
ncbi:MAG: CsgG/HfaB family protein, partial [Sedimentisphaerales bacterium]